MKKIVIVMSQTDLRRKYVSHIRDRYAGHYTILVKNVFRALSEIAEDPREVAVLVVAQDTYRDLRGHGIEQFRVSTILVVGDVSDAGDVGQARIAKSATFEAVLRQLLESG